MHINKSDAFARSLEFGDLETLISTHQQEKTFLREHKDAQRFYTYVLDAYVNTYCTAQGTRIVGSQRRKITAALYARYKELTKLGALNEPTSID